MKQKEKITKKKRAQKELSNKKMEQSKKRKKTINKTKKRSKNKKLAKKKRNRKKEKRQQFIKEISISLSVLLGLLFLIQVFFFSFPSVEGYGMTPFLNDGERVIVIKKRPVKRFDLVYIRQPGTQRMLIRRVIGLPEEEIDYREDQLFINQQPVVERFLKNEQSEAKSENRLLTDNFSLGTVTNEHRLPKNGYFVLGDNRHYAADSRNFGWVEKKDVLGVVKVRVFPLHQMTQF